MAQNKIKAADINSVAGTGDTVVLQTSGTFTPVLTFTTPGNLTVVYAAQAGSYVRHGNLVTINFTAITSTFTHTTASGTLQLTGLPFTGLAGEQSYGSMQFAGITKATFTYFAPRVNGAVTNLEFVANGSGVSPTTVQASDTPTGGTVNLRGTVTYRI